VSMISCCCPSVSETSMSSSPQLRSLSLNRLAHRAPMPGLFLENSRTWKVLENHFDRGKSWKLKLKVLESPGKISLKVMQQAAGTEKLLNCFYNHCMYIETIY